VLALNPRAAIAANNLSYMMLTTHRDTDTALQLAQTAYRESPADSHISDTLGWAYFCKEMKTEAVRQLQDSVKLDPRNPNAQYHLGMAYAATGDTVAAKRALQKVVALKSTEQSEAAKKALAELDSNPTAAIIK
jgi:Flp pilus assembly protein TadD